MSRGATILRSSFTHTELKMMPKSFIQTGLLASFGFLIILGLLMVFSSSAILADTNYHDSFYFFKRQVLFVGVALIATYICFSIQTNFYKEYSIVFYGLGIALLLLVLIPGLGKSA